MSGEFDLEGFEQDLDEALARSREAFQGKYKDELNQLMGLSKADIDSISPGITDVQIYDQLIAVVKEASRQNMAQAQLVKRIKGLGNVAVAIAKKVPAFSGIL